MKAIYTTFDSNVWECIADTKKLADHSDAEALTAIRRAIEAGRIAPYISDVVVTLESVKKHDRESYSKGITVKIERTKEAIEVEEDGTQRISSEIKIRPCFDHHPGLHEKLAAALEKALALGFRFINVPRIGWLRLDDDLYKPMETDEQELAARLNRANEAIRAFEQEGVGSAHILALANQAIQQNPELAPLGQFRAFAYGDPTKIPGAVAEWADGDALAAHYSHGHDVFCTLDRGKSAGFGSVLHKSRRRWLQEKFRIQIFTPTELAAHISCSA